MLLLHHNCTGSVFFKDKNEAKKSFNESKYSVLYLLSYFRSLTDFEFLLEYPDINKVNHWKQRDNPLFVSKAGATKASGYEPINIQMEDNNWGGLLLSTRSETLIDGSIGSGYWFYAIGQVNDQYGTSPGYLAGSTGSTTVVNLWIKFSIHFLHNNSCAKHSSHNKMTILSLTLISMHSIHHTN